MAEVPEAGRGTGPAGNIRISHQLQRRMTWLHSELTRTGERLRSMAEASPGPWWGFDGVRTLAVTDRRLLVVRSSPGPSSRGRSCDPRLAAWWDLSEIEQVHVSRRHGLFGRPPVCQLRVRVRGGQRRLFTSRAAEAAERLARDAAGPDA